MASSIQMEKLDSSYMVSSFWYNLTNQTPAAGDALYLKSKKRFLFLLYQNFNQKKLNIFN